MLCYQASNKFRQRCQIRRVKNTKICSFSSKKSHKRSALHNWNCHKNQWADPSSPICVSLRKKDMERTCSWFSSSSWMTFTETLWMCCLSYDKWNMLTSKIQVITRVTEAPIFGQLWKNWWDLFSTLLHWKFRNLSYMAEIVGQNWEISSSSYCNN